MAEQTFVPKPAFMDWKQDLGPLRQYFSDPNVSEIMVNGPDSIFIEMFGVVSQVDAKFANAEALNKLIQSMVVSAGKEVNRKNSVVDLILPDGSRANCVVPPAAIDGPMLTIRKFMIKVLDLNQLIKNQTFDDKIVFFLHRVVGLRQNILVSGGTGSGKTTMLNLLGSFIPAKERLITIEDTPELAIPHKNIVRLECRPPKGGDPGISVQELLRAALRMRPDRIIVGECRGPEAFDMLQAMNTGHEGSMATVHANSCADAPRRLEGMILRSENNLNGPALRKDIFETLGLIVQCERTANGKRRVSEIAELIPGPKGDGEAISLFVATADGGFTSTGTVPTFLNLKEAAGVFPDRFFDPSFVVKLAA